MMDETAGTTVNRDVLGTSPAEEYPARTKPSPVKPSIEEIARHETTHCPFRSWCPACVAASAKDYARPQRSREADEGGRPLVSLDYESREEKITVVHFASSTSGALWLAELSLELLLDLYETLGERLAGHARSVHRPRLCARGRLKFLALNRSFGVRQARRSLARAASAAGSRARTASTRSF